MKHYYDYKNQDVWLDWQKIQPPSHFMSSSVYQKFAKTNLEFHIEHDIKDFGYATRVFDSSKETYYKHVFGDFYNFVMYIPQPKDLLKSITMLISLYDHSKGYSRLVFGDPPIISFIKSVLVKHPVGLFDLTEVMNDFGEKDFSVFVYDYSVLHAHTVAYFSLSSLIALLVSNIIGRIKENRNHPVIELFKCKSTYESGYWPILQELTPTTTIPIPITTVPRNMSKSWPIVDNSKCRHCKRLTEGSWGKFGSCLDCHSKVICSSCGATASGRDKSNTPKCEFHLKLEEFQ